MKDPHLTPLNELYDKHMRMGGNADWYGNHTAADWHYKQAEEIKRRMDAGELYEPNF